MILLLHFTIMSLENGADNWLENANKENYNKMMNLDLKKPLVLLITQPL